MKPGAYIDRQSRRPRYTPYQRKKMLIVAVCCFGMAAGLVMVSVGMNILEVLK